MSSDYDGFSAEERAAMKEHAQQLKKESRRGSKADKAAAAAQDVLQPAAKHKARYATLGFEEAAKLDDGAMWPVP